MLDKISRSNNEITRPAATITKPHLQKILVLWLLFSSGNDMQSITDDIWKNQIKPHLQDFDNPDGFLEFARGNAQGFTIVSSFFGSFTQDLWGGGGICPTPPIDWIADLFPQ